ncbi:hypothetical protein PVMG_05142 [Plasmodium vivax Mauritania I]|uniref:PIR Superfamily Protein n=1 Tax=Plasmodium vivax Mauritania I TaxID=1035515 RepID=A0A0J9TJ39_PLAVI|nr:hypothetical protein PVMG_05142 [Plasmodium vivax Mauritania I]
MTPKPIKEYDFFENIDRYIKDGKSIEDIIEIDNSSTYCYTFTEIWGKKSGNKEIAKNICYLFVSLYKHLKNEEHNYNKDFAFLNYRVNMKIHEGVFNNDTTVSDFCRHIDSHVLHDIGYEILDDLIYDIDKDELYKMNILYSLYENYSKLYNIINTNPNENKPSLLPFSTKCCNYYNQVKYICNDDNNKESTFCKKLRDFVTKHDGLYNIFEGKRSQFSDDLIKLEECPDNKIITTAVTGTVVGLIPLFGVLYKVSE